MISEAMKPFLVSNCVLFYQKVLVYVIEILSAC